MNLQEQKIELISSITHGFGVGLSITALVLLIIKGVTSGTVWHIVAFSIFGSSLVLLYLASTLYHAFPKGSLTKKVFQRIDHCMIYVLIAGTYTPFAFVSLKGVMSWVIFGIVWGMAILGIVWKGVALKFPSWISLLFYIFMGWIGVIVFAPLLRTLTWYGFIWLIMGGIFYTIGAYFFALDDVVKTKILSCHDVFHILVLSGSFAHFSAMWWYV